MLGRLTDSLPDDALIRIAEPTALWVAGYQITEGGARCLAGHAWGVRYASGVQSYDNWFGPLPRVGDRFDALCYRFSVARVSSACRLRAERELARRGLVPVECAPDAERVGAGRT